MMPLIDITEQRFNRLIAKARIRNSKGKIVWQCLCDCGKTTLASGSDLRAGKQQSCGCHRIEISTKRATTHGNSTSPEYRTWTHMLDRCYRQSDAGYKNYGGRGIKVFFKWRKSFAEFFSYVGQRPSPKHTIDRINNGGNYEPGNVRWATRSQQVMNRRTTRRLTLNGITKTIPEWSDQTGLKYHTIKSRIYAGLTPEQILAPLVKALSR